ncbi:hypothetical protein [Streptomyces sp. NPDC020983]|uniref:hypothetical protein n=1 Tax=Streptomyces sp. NPDC020983 TaxID=3365106 RepID=UPI003799CE60
MLRPQVTPPGSGTGGAARARTHPIAAFAAGAAALPAAGEAVRRGPRIRVAGTAAAGTAAPGRTDGDATGRAADGDGPATAAQPAGALREEGAW